MTDEDLRDLPRYVNIGFHINAPGYDDWSREKQEELDEEAYALFEGKGWRREGRSVFKDKASLYLHPYQFAGVVLESDVPGIAASIKGAKFFSLRTNLDGTDMIVRHNVCYDITAEQQRAYMEGKEPAIRESLLSRFTTKNRSTYVGIGMWYPVFKELAEPFLIRAVDQRVENLAAVVVSEILGKLVAEGKILHRVERNASAYRTLRECEKRKS